MTPPTIRKTTPQKGRPQNNPEARWLFFASRAMPPMTSKAPLASNNTPAYAAQPVPIAAAYVSCMRCS